MRCSRRPVAYGLTSRLTADYHGTAPASDPYEFIPEYADVCIYLVFEWWFALCSHSHSSNVSKGLTGCVSKELSQPLDCIQNTINCIILYNCIQKYALVYIG